MKKSWAITLTVEHEHQYGSGKKATAELRTVAKFLIEGDDESCDAAWATSQCHKVWDKLMPGSYFRHIVGVHVEEAE